ncbi:MAG: Clp protease N-terminal domain-containing protein [Acidimicrobiales bacterium]
MFERFTDGARQVLVQAQDEATGLSHHHIGTEHLLLALLSDGGIAGTVLARAGVQLESTRAATAKLVGPDAYSGTEADAAALSSIGIDLGAVRASVEHDFGAGALDRTHRCRWRRGRAGAGRVSGTPFTPRAKKALELALRESLRLRHRFIGPEHVLLGVLREGRGAAVTVLVGHGVALDALRDDLVSALGQVA